MFLDGKARVSLKQEEEIILSGYLKDFSWCVISCLDNGSEREEKGKAILTFDPASSTYKGQTEVVHLLHLFYKLPSTGRWMGSWLYTVLGSAALFLALQRLRDRKRK